VSGNPNGRPKAPKEILELQDTTKLEVIKAINEALILTPDELKRKLADPKATMAQHLVGSILSKAIKEGCFARAQFLVNYVLGRPKTFEMPEGEDEGTPNAQQVLKGVPSSILLEMVKSAQGSIAVE
jgi:hypothetical protein